MSDAAASAPETPWTLSDAWTLAAMSTRRRGSDLSRIIANGDAINHSILTRDELASALGALRAAGLVEAKDGRLRTTRAGRELRKHWRGGMFQWLETLLPELAKLPRPSEEYALSEAEWERAYDAYAGPRRR